VSSISLPPPERVVAAFDFDGTLSTRDNFMPFLKLVAGTRAIGSALAAGTARCGARGRKAWKRDEIKAEVIRRLFTGRNAVVLETLDPDEIVERCEELSSSPERASRLRRNAKQTARQYTWQAVLPRLVEPLQRQARRQGLIAAELASA